MILLACTTPTLDSASETASPVDEAEAPVPPELAEVQAAAQAAIDQGLPDPFAPRDAYLAALAEGDASCPGGDPLQLDDSVILGCTAGSGWHYAGISSWLDQEPEFDLFLEGELTAPTGEALIGAGHARYVLAGEGVELMLEGTWVGEGQPSWLGQGFSGSWYASLGGSDEFVSAWWTVGGTSLGFEPLQWNAGCADGQVAVRTDEGWVEATLACGCGEATFYDQPLGELCLDLEAALADLRAQL